MKNIILILSFLLVAFSCEKKDNLENLKKNREELTKKVNELNKELKEINLEIEKLEPTKKITQVATKTLSLEKFEHYVELQANVETDKNVMIYPELPGVMNLLVQEGQYVSAGQTIAIINDGGLKDQVKQQQITVESTNSNLQQAQVQADLAKTTFLKQSTLWKQKIGSEIQYLQAKTAYEAAQKQVEAVRNQVSATQKGVLVTKAQLARTVVKAPFSGVIDEVLTQNHQAVAPGVPIVRLVNTTGLKVKAEVPETYIGSVQKGTSVKIELPNIGESIQTQISRVSTLINPNNRTFSVEIPVPNNGLVKPNLLAKIKIIDYLNPNAYVVPNSVIKEDDQGKFYVFVYEKSTNNEGIAKKVYVTKGKTSGNYTEIKNGLSSNIQVITEGVNFISEGSKVKL